MDEILDIREVILCYLKSNNLSIRYMSKRTGIRESTLRAWIDGRRNISSEKMKKIYSFLNGKFLLSIEMICNYLGIDIDRTPLDELVKLFIRYNHLSVNKVSKSARIPETTLRNYLNGEVYLHEKYAINLRNVLRGDYLLPFETCCSYLINQRENNDDNRSNRERDS